MNTTQESGVSVLISSIVETTQAGIAISDLRQPDQPLVYVNAAFERLTGYPSGEVLGRNCRFLQGPIRDQSEVAVLRTAIANHQSVRTLIRNYRKDGEMFWNELSLAPIRDCSGVVTHYFSMFFDVSDRVAHHDRRERLSENWRVLLDASMGLTFVIDAAGTITFGSDAVSRKTGLAPGAAIGRNWFDVLRVEDPATGSAHLERLVRKEIESVSFEVLHRNAQGERAWLGCQARDALDHPNIRGIVIAAHDISGEKLAEQLAYEAHHDSLTKVYNRHYLQRWYEALQNETRAAQTSTLMWLVDLDQFKALNDSFGHSAGDQFLQAYARSLEHALAPHWIVARLGGDEFGVMGNSNEAERDIVVVSERILEVSRAAFEVASTSIALSASVGVAETSAPFDSFDDLMRNADIAMYEAKAKGRNTYQRYETDTGERAKQRNALLRDLASAYGRGEFVVAYQPIVDARTRAAVKYEALLRWDHPTHGLMSADRFIDELALTGLCETVTLWVLECALTDHYAALATGRMQVSLNVWARSFHHADFAQRLIETIRGRGLAPSCVDIEIIETEFVLAGPVTADNLARLGENGIRLVIDDFGKGFSNLSYLQRWNVQGLKIDGSFIWKIGQDEKSEKLIRALLGLAKDLGVDVVAEGIETEAQRAFLLREGCTVHQGFLYGRPTTLSVD
jgi:diguanylate cyclase (GGDEF)-like protein/PAS domain S-box-containing protein